MDIDAWQAIVANWPNDWIILGALAILVSLDALRSGSARAASIALSLPVTLLLVTAIPHTFFLGPLTAQFSSPAVLAITFLVILTAMYFMVHRTVFTFSDGGAIIQSLIIGMVAVVVLVVVWLQVPALESLWHFEPQVQEVFGPAYRFWWLVAAFFGLALARS